MRGWIPAFLPNSATDIIEQHSIDTNVGYVTFKANRSDMQQMKDDCAPLNNDAVKYPSPYPLWWPFDLTEPTKWQGSTGSSLAVSWKLWRYSMIVWRTTGALRNDGQWPSAVAGAN